MRAYNYFLFRIYIFYRDIIRVRNDNILFSVSVISSLCIWFNIFTLITLKAVITRSEIENIFPNKYSILPYIIAIWVLNHYLVVKRKFFLEYNFNSDRKGGLLVVIYMLFTLTSFILVANENRHLIHEKHPETMEMDTTRGSLEKDIRDWFKKK